MAENARLIGIVLVLAIAGVLLLNVGDRTEPDGLKEIESVLPIDAKDESPALQVEPPIDEKEIPVVLEEDAPADDTSATEGLVVSGIVFGPDGQPMADANIFGSVKNGSRGDFTKTKKNGQFALSGFEPGTTVTLGADHESYAFTPIQISIISESVSGLELYLVPEAVVTGLIIDPSGTPVPNAFLYLTSGPGNTPVAGEISNEQGEITFRRLVDGTYTVKQTEIDHVFKADDPVTATVTVSSGQRVDGLRFVWKELYDTSFEISGRVMNDIGSAIPDTTATVHRRGNRKKITAVSGPDGRYTLSGLTNGDHSISFKKSGHFTDGVRVPAGSTSADIALDRLGSIRGQVIDGTTGSPVEDFQLLLSNYESDSLPVNGYKRINHPEGRFEIDDVRPNATVYLYAKAEGLGDTVLPIEGVRCAETLTGVIVRMDGGLRLTGQVVSHEGKPVGGVRIYQGRVPHSDSEREKEMVATTDGDGRFELTDLATGPLTLAAHKKGYSPAKMTTPLSPGTSELTLTLGNAPTISGVVTLDGNPAPGASLYGNVLHPAGVGDQIRATTDSDGRFVIEGVHTGWGYLQANVIAGSISRNMRQDIHVVDGHNADIEFHLTTATSSIEGILLDADLQPISGRVRVKIDSDGVSESRSAQVGTDGLFYLDSLPAGEVQLSGYKTSNRFPKYMVRMLGEGEALQLDVHLEGGAQVFVHLQDPSDDMYWMAYLFPASSPVPTVFDEHFQNRMYQGMVGDAIVEDGTAVFNYVDAGDYNVALIGSPKNRVEGVRPTIPMTSASVTVKDEAEVHVNISF